MKVNVLRLHRTLSAPGRSPQPIRCIALGPSSASQPWMVKTACMQKRLFNIICRAPYTH